MSRELIDVQFQDNSNYVDSVTTDTLGSVISASWGPKEKLVTVNLTQFLSMFPAESNPHESWIRVRRAFDGGIGSAELYRTADNYVYQGATLKATGASPDTVYSLEAVSNAVIPTPDYFTVYSKYQGNFPVSNPKIQVVWSTVDGEAVIGLALYSGDNLVEMVEGTLVPGQIVDGQNVYIGDVVTNSSSYFNFVVKDPAALATIVKAKEQTLELVITPQTPTEVDSQEDAVAALYPSVFGDFTTSAATILVPWSNDSGVVASVINTAEAACDRVALIGYDTTKQFTKAEITSAYQTMPKAMFAAFYAAREAVNVNISQIPADGIGTIAGRLAAVADSDSVNQLPSSYSYGAFPGTLLNSVSFSDAIAFQADGINTVISSTEGPMIYGIKSMYSRQSSYFAKFNCMRVIARILQSTFPLLMTVHHTPNTVRKRSSIQTNRQTFLATLIAQDALKADSLAICNDTNNTPSATNDGEILILDFNLGFVNLIQRFLVRVIANEAGISANVTIQ